MSDSELILELYQAKLADSSAQPIEQDYIKFIKQITRGIKYGELDLTGVQGSYNVFSRVPRIIRQFTKIYSLKFFANLNKDLGMQRILQILRTIPRITVMDIGCNDVSDESASLITDIITFTNIVSLQLGKKGRNLSMNRFTRDGITNMLRALEERNNLKCLGMSGIGSIRQKKTRKFMEYSSLIGSVIAKCNKLSTLDISECGFTDMDVIPLAVGFEANKTLRHLSLSGNPFTEANDLIRSISTIKTLRFLNISKSGITAEAIEHLCLSLKQGLSLIVLMVNDNPIGSKGISSLFRALKDNIYLTSLNCCCTGADKSIGPDVEQFLATSEVIHDLDLSKNHISDEGVAAISRSLTKQNSLKRLNLSSCRISDNGAKTIAMSIVENKSLSELILRDNFLTRNAGYDMLDILQTNCYITNLDLSSNQLDVFASDAIRTMCNRNKSTEVDETLSELRKKHINLSIEKAKIPDTEVRYNKLLEEKKQLNEEIAELQAQIDREREIMDQARRDNEKTFEEMNQFINDDKKVITDTEASIEALKEQRKVDIMTIENKCKLEEQEFDRYEAEAFKFTKMAEQIRKNNEEEKKKLTEQIADIENLIRDVKEALKNKQGMLDYQIPENPYIEKEVHEVDEATKLARIRSKKEAAEDDEYFRRLQEENLEEERRKEAEQKALEAASKKKKKKGSKKKNSKK